MKMKFGKLEFKWFPSIPAVFFDTVSKYPNKVCFQYYKDNKIDGEIQQKTFKEYKELVIAVSGGLLNLGVKPKEHISILAESRYEWCISDIAILSLNCCSVTIFPTLAYDQVRFILDDSDSVGVFVSTQEQLEKVMKTWQEKLPKLKFVIIFDEYNLDLGAFFKSTDVSEFKKKIILLKDLIEMGTEYNSQHTGEVEQIISGIQETDLASIIYTSGTTGIPKGVMLSHKNFLSNVMMGAISVHPSHEEVSVTYLPLSHSFTRTVEHFGMIVYGATLSFAVSHATLQKSMLDFKPTSMIGVPYVFETMLRMIRQTVAKKGPKVEKVFWNAVEIGKKVSELKQEVKPIPLGLKIKYALVKKLILSQIRKNFGGRINHFLSGSAPLNPETAKFFDAIGIPVYEGYGLTEAAPITHTNSDSPVSNFKPAMRFGKVGPLIGKDKFGSTHPYEPMEQRLSDIGELLVAGPNIMMGYYKRPEETAAALEKIDGKIWLHTGDLAEIDSDGYAKIVGRAKEIIVLKTGKKVAPNLIEPIYEEHPYIHQIMLLGEGEKFIAALVVPNMDYKGEICKKASVPEDISLEDFYKDPKIHKIFEEVLKEAEQGRVADYESIKKFAFVKEFTEAEGLLSPTLKLKRKKIYEKYKSIISQIYND